MSPPTHRMVQTSWDRWDYVPDDKVQKKAQADAKATAPRQRKPRGHAAS